MCLQVQTQMMLSCAAFPAAAASQTRFIGTCYQLLSLLCAFQIQLAGICSSILLGSVQERKTVPSLSSLPAQLATVPRDKREDSFEHLCGRTPKRTDLNSCFRELCCCLVFIFSMLNGILPARVDSLQKLKLSASSVDTHLNVTELQLSYSSRSPIFHHLSCHHSIGACC